jgi:uracil-DNA glycosylase
MAALKRKAEPSTASSSDLKKPKKDASLTSFFGAPKTASASLQHATSQSSTAASSQPPLAKFDKEKWVSGLSDEQRKLLKLEIDTLDSSWLAYLREDVVHKDFLELKRFLQREIDSGMKIFPPLEEVYSWLVECLSEFLTHPDREFRSRHTPLNTVKAVILGQDPYHNHNQAHGLCFSVRPPTPAPPSLKNMYIALKNDYPSFTPPPKNGGLLTPWAEQGVLMLNTCLTVRAHEANSHSNKGWEKFTQKVIDMVAKVRGRGVVFLAWGAPAAKRVAKINKAKHLVLQSVHPSPLSAHKGFMNCGHFKKTNSWLAERYGVDAVIDWNLNQPKPIAAPPTSTPIKATEVQKEAEERDGPTTELPERMNGALVNTKDEFDDEEDEDAIEALEAIANSSVNGDAVEVPAETSGEKAEVEEKDVAEIVERAGKSADEVGEEK